MTDAAHASAPRILMRCEVLLLRETAGIRPISLTAALPSVWRTGGLSQLEEGRRRRLGEKETPYCRRFRVFKGTARERRAVVTRDPEPASEPFSYSGDQTGSSSSNLALRHYTLQDYNAR